MGATSVLLSFSLKLIQQIQQVFQPEKEYMEVHSKGNENKDSGSVIKNLIFRIFSFHCFHLTWSAQSQNKEYLMKFVP